MEEEKNIRFNIFVNGSDFIIFLATKNFPTSIRHFLVKYKSAREALILAASLKDRLEEEVRTYSADNNLTVQTIDFLYAGPHMRGRHSLILAFTEAGIFTFVFKLSDAEMHFLDGKTVQQIALEKKKLVYRLYIRAVTEEGELEEGKYLVSKRVLERKWHKETLEKLINKNLPLLTATK